LPEFVAAIKSAITNVMWEGSMVWENPVRVERAIKKLTRELEEIDDFFYGYEKAGDRVLYLGQLERKRDDVIRSGVLQIHTAIEDLMTEMLFSWILGAEHRKSGRKRRTKRGHALSEMLSGRRSLGFYMKLNFAVVVGIITPKIQTKLLTLNTLRNSCSHNWLLCVAANNSSQRFHGARMAFPSL
jgi:hypothetical protein